ncbi:MAG: hypothetical protein LC808_16425 [Actinobacteria bacterium]|nr:hypothetical protein [Actinomycetota bacterium]
MTDAACLHLVGVVLEDELGELLPAGEDHQAAGEGREQVPDVVRSSGA